MTNNSSKKKAELLGEPAGTANAKLRKAIIFWLVQETGRDICYRCGEKISTIDELSIEHKESWMTAENPAEAFHNLDNISFSHLGCNCSAADRHFPHPLQRGENGGLAKLKWNQVREIRGRLKDGAGLTELAEEYLVSPRTISGIRDNETWKEY